MSATRSADVTGRRLGHAVLAYLAIIVAVVTLTPFRFVLPPVNTLGTQWIPFDVVMNVVMFVPLGFIYRLSRPRAQGTVWLGALLAGAALSASVEAAQFFTPDRYPSLNDLVTNSAGAGVGAWLGSLAVRRADAAATVRAFAVELPLMGLVYLLAPLPWLIGLGDGVGARAWVLVPLAASAGWIIGSVFTSFESARSSRVLVATAAWLFVALGPSAIRSVEVAALAAAAGLGVAWVRTVAPSRLTHEADPGGAPRRFEASTLRVVFPLLILYLLMSSLAPLSELRGPWRGTWALLPEGASLTNDVIFAAIERISAFTVLGYAIAEYHGRSRTGLAKLFPVVFAWAAAGSALLELARGYHASHGASATLFTLTVVGAGLGAWVYTLQLAHVRAVVRPEAGTAPAGA